MSKNTMGLKDFAAMASVIAMDPDPEVVTSIAEELSALPEFGVLDQMTAMLQDAERLETLSVAAFSKAGDEAVLFPALLAKIYDLRGQLFDFKVTVKAMVMNSAGIAKDRLEIFGIKTLSEFLEEKAREAIQSNFGAAAMQKELVGLVAEAEASKARTNQAVAYAKELRNAKLRLETEAEKLLASANLV